MRKKIAVSIGFCLLFVLIVFWSAQKVITTSVLATFRLPESKQVTRSDEQLKQGIAAVSFDESRRLYLLSDDRWTVYRFSPKQGLTAISLNRNGSDYVDLTNGSLAVSKSGNVLWCYCSGPAKKSAGYPYGWAMLLRAYSNKGKLIQQWQFPSGSSDVGFIQTVGDNSALVVKGGSNSFYTIGSEQPQVSDDYITSNDFIDWNGEIWNIYNTDKRSTSEPKRNVKEIPRLSTGRTTTSFDTHPWIEKPASPLEFLPFWRSPSGVYLRKRIKEYEGQTAFGFGLYRMDDKSMIPIANLKKTDDPLFQKIGQKISIGAALWGEGNSVTLYASEDLPAKASRVPNHYLIRVASVPRWKTWFSRNP